MICFGSILGKKGILKDDESDYGNLYEESSSEDEAPLQAVPRKATNQQWIQCQMYMCELLKRYS